VNGSRPPRLWIVDPSAKRPEEQGIGSILDGWPGESRVFRPALRPSDGPRPESGWDADGFVLMGSAASVHDRLPWIESLAAWLRPLLTGEVRAPLFGICFGHQLIAHVAGGEVAFLTDDRAKRLGIELSELDGSRLLPGRHGLQVVVSHREEVRRLPDGFRRVACRPAVEVDGMEHAQLPVFSFQFHPEAREEFAGHVGIEPVRIDSRVRADSRRLLGAFRDHVLAAAGGTRSKADKN
jgi:GMP synthase-like glutamine amidotransferase